MNFASALAQATTMRDELRQYCPRADIAGVLAGAPGALDDIKELVLVAELPLEFEKLSALRRFNLVWGRVHGTESFPKKRMLHVTFTHSDQYTQEPHTVHVHVHWVRPCEYGFTLFRLNQGMDFRRTMEKFWKGSYGEYSLLDKDGAEICCKTQEDVTKHLQSTHEQINPV